MDEHNFGALILAASRGPGDPVAVQTGVSCKALAPVGGKPMLARVLGTLLAFQSGLRVAISSDEAHRLQDHPGLALLLSDERVTLLGSADSPSKSVVAAVHAFKTPYPLLITTADSALISHDIVDYFWEHALASKADLAVGLVPASLLKQHYPSARRTFLRFREHSYSSCNLFALLTPEGLKALEFWAQIEQHRKQPWRLVGAFGIGALLRFALRLLSLDDAMAHASRRLGITVRAIVMPYAEAAIDVDTPEDLDLVNRIISGTRSG